MRQWVSEEGGKRYLVTEHSPDRLTLKEIGDVRRRYFRDGVFLTDWSFWCTIVIIGLFLLWAHLSPGGPPPEGEYCIRETW